MTGRPRRYVTWPAIYLERLTVRVDGKIQYELKNLFRRGRLRITMCPFCGGTMRVIVSLFS
jgi:hypothetical protein